VIAGSGDNEGEIEGDNMLRAGLIGTDNIAENHWQALLRIGSLHPWACFDRQFETARQFAALHNLEAVAGYDQIIDRSDLVYVGNIQMDLKQEIILNAIEKGVPYLLCEPPFPLLKQDSAALTAKMNGRRMRLMVGFAHRFKEPYRQWQSQLVAGRLGEPVTLWAHICDGWGTELVRKYLQEEIDLIRWIGGEISGIRLHTAVVATVEIPRKALSIIFNLVGGMLASLMLNWDNEFKIVRRGLIGREGTTVMEEKGFSRPERIRFQFADSEPRQSIEFSSYDRQDPGILAMYRMLLEKGPGPAAGVGLADGLRTAALMEQILEKANLLAEC
jgi:predicted dehydrogenase